MSQPRRWAGIFAAALTLAAGLAVGQESSPAPVAIDPPAPPGSALPVLAVEGPTTVNREPEVLATWLEPGGRLRFARFSRGAWGPPVTVAEQVSTLDPADAPSLAVIETHGVRRTLLARTGDAVASSGDGGRSWTRLPAPPLAFASFAGGEEGAFAFWLDPAADGSARLLGTRVLEGETLLDPRAAAGAGTAAAMTWDGPVVVYQAGSAGQEREIALVRRQEARWTVPGRVNGEEWRPVAGPAGGLDVVAEQRMVAVAWIAGTPRGPRLAVAFSGDAGRTFGAPVAVGAPDDPVPAGPVAVALDEDGHALVLWTAAAGASGAAALHLARVAPDGRQGQPLTLATASSAPALGRPQLARAGGQVAVAWTEAGAGDTPGRVRAVAVALATLPPLASPRLTQPARAGGAAEAYTGRGRVGDAVPGFELVSLQGDEVSLPSLRGRPVLLNLWATWCLPCIEELPELAALQERHRGEGLAVVGVNVDAADRIDRVRKFVADRKVPFAVWLDPEMSIAKALRVQTLPATFVIDREGRIVLRRDLQLEAGDRELAEAMRRVLGVGPATPR